jgi:hypothetical protein
METETMSPADRALWRQAHARVSFKRHAFIYLMVNAGLWVIWLFNHYEGTDDGYTWPFWPMFGWGIGLALHYVSTYRLLGGTLFSAEEEYQKLKEKGQA